MPYRWKNNGVAVIGKRGRLKCQMAGGLNAGTFCWVWLSSSHQKAAEASAHRIWDLWIWMYDVLGRADQDFGNTGRLRQDTIRHRDTLAGEWIDGLGWLAGWLVLLVC